MNVDYNDDRKRKRLKQWSIEESFKRQKNDRGEDLLQENQGNMPNFHDPSPQKYLIVVPIF